MNSTHWLVILVIFIIMLLALNLIINYTSRKDKENPPSLKVKIWLVPVLASLIILPVAIFTTLYSMFFYNFGKASGFIYFNQFGDIIVFSVLIIIGFLIFETLIHPIIVTVLNYGLKRQVSVYTRNSITLIMDSLIIYILASSFNGIYILDYWSALSISVFYHIIDWGLTLIFKFGKKLNRKK
ncbi:hypothetical protein [Paenibacillus sp. FSL H8-0079]|uniref:hypothetical protein n=1 Tax=Paenibacillus sp. FSL H8-0079 TaxID=2921375 RepID=UPI0030ED4335